MSSSRLLHTRPLCPPPTPPRVTHVDEGATDEATDEDPIDEIDQALLILADGVGVDDVLNSFQPRKSSIDTPEQSPFSTAARATISGGKTRKKVGFSPWNVYNKAPSYTLNTPGQRTPVRILPPSRELKAKRSILKPFNNSPSPATTPNSTTQPFPICSSRTFDDFHTMLEAALDQLASPERDMKLDAYLTLSNHMQAVNFKKDDGQSQGVIEPIRNQLDRLCGLIFRDLSSVNPATNACDASLACQACKALFGLIQIPSISDNFTDEFRISLIKKSIVVLEDLSMPKAITLYFMFLLHEQNFPLRIMTVERAQRILNALQFIDDRIKGNSVIGSRVLIYKKLAEQVPSVMVLRVPDWLEHIFHAMLSSVTELRNRAIQAAISIAVAVGNSGDVALTLDAAFKHERDGVNNDTYGHYFCDRLLNMLEPQSAHSETPVLNVDESRSVPQIWRAVVLLLRSRRHRIESWRYLRKWLSVIQKCFNSKDLQTKIQTQVAWNAFVYVVMPDKNASDNLQNMLKQPLIPQLATRANDKFTKKVRTFALSSYCNLLYYSLRPTLTPAEKTRHWIAHMIPFTEHLAGRSTSDADAACNILFAVLGGCEQRLWNEHRAESVNLMTYHELPSQDPKWIRQNTKLVLQVIRPLLKTSTWPAIGQNDSDVPVTRMWMQLMTALQQAGSKEVTTSQELKETIAQVLTLLHEVWETKDASLGKAPGFLRRFHALANPAIAQLGPLHFTGLIFKRSSKAGWDITPTSCHAQNKPDRLESPLEHLLLLLARYDEKEDLEFLGEMLSSYVTMFMEQMKGPDNRRILLGSLCSALTAQSKGLNVAASHVIWGSLVAITSRVLLDPQKPNSPQSSPLLEAGHRAVSQIVCAGLYFAITGSQGLLCAHNLFQAAVKVYRVEVGPGTATLFLVRPLCEEIDRFLHDDKLTHSTIKSGLPNCCLFLSLLLEMDYQNQSDREVWLAQKMLHSNATKPKENSAPYDSIISTLPALLHGIYARGIPGSSKDALAKLFDSLGDYFARMPQAVQLSILKKLSSSVSVFVADPKHILGDDKYGGQGLRDAIRSSYKSMLRAVSSGPCDSIALATFEEIIVAGLSSTLKTMLADSVDLWNASFGQTASLQYPLRVQEALQRLRPVSDLKLPDFPVIYVDSAPIVSELESFPRRSGDKNSETESQLPIRRPSLSPHPRRSTSIPLADGAPSRTRKDGAMSLSASAPKATPRKMLRHEDSQIEFPAVTSSLTSQPDIEESQHLTEHQMEVSERQQQEALLYSDLILPSSSSVFQSPAWNAAKPSRARPRPTSLQSMNAKLRSSSTNDDEIRRPSTPPLPAAAGLLSDDLPGSSPTPSSQPASDARVVSSVRHRAVIREVDIFDLPSSPPRAEDTPQNVSAHGASDFPNSNEPFLEVPAEITVEDQNVSVIDYAMPDVVMLEDEVAEDKESCKDVEADEDVDMQDHVGDMSDSPSSDTRLLTAQLDAEHESFLESQERPLQSQIVDEGIIGGGDLVAEPQDVYEEEDTEKEDEMKVDDHIKETTLVPMQPPAMDVNVPATDESEKAVKGKHVSDSWQVEMNDSIADSFVTGPVAPVLVEMGRADNGARIPGAQQSQSAEDDDFEDTVFDNIVVTPRSSAISNSQGSHRRPSRKGVVGSLHDRRASATSSQISQSSGSKRRVRLSKSASQAADVESKDRTSQRSATPAKRTRGRPRKLGNQAPLPRHVARSESTSSNISTISGAGQALVQSGSDRLTRGHSRRLSELSFVGMPAAYNLSADLCRRRAMFAPLEESRAVAPAAVASVAKAKDKAKVQVNDTPAPLGPNKRRKFDNRTMETTARDGSPQAKKHIGEQNSIAATRDSLPSQDSADAAQNDAMDEVADSFVDDAADNVASSASHLHNEMEQHSPRPLPVTVSSRKRKHADVDEDDSSGPEPKQGQDEDGARSPTVMTRQGSPDRRALSTSSFLDGLRRILSDCKGLVMGGEDEKQAHDLLLKIQKEVFKAAQRGEQK